jgi:glycosyltransferase involved in cell wall biosynthesis
MDLVALVESPDHVCCRYRLAAFRPYLERAGHRLELRSLPRNWWARLRLGRSVRPADVVILQRRLLRGWQLALLRRGSRRLVFDFDDAVFLRDSYAVKGPHSAVRRRRFGATVRAADAVVAGNDFLRHEAAGQTDAGRVHIVPTCVRPEVCPQAEHTRSGNGVRLVWIGSSSTLRGLEAVRPLLEALGRRLPGLRLHLVCDRFLELEHLPVVPCPWSAATEAADVATADIGISYLPDDLWSRGKCGLKVLQYLAAGLPVVANPVGVQVEMVRHGETGFLAETPEQWAEAVGRLAADPDLRRRMGQAGRRLVETSYSVESGARRWLSLLDGLRAAGSGDPRRAPDPRRADAA